MKRDLRTIIAITLLAGLALPQLALAQTYDIPASVVGSGGGTATSASYSLSGTVGQPAADIGLSGGSYNHDAGFWPAAQALTGGAPSVPTASTDSLALVALYNSTGGSGWNNAWDLGTPVTDWFGVTVADGRVTGLNLNRNNLSGPIPAKIGDLTGLTYLNLSWNDLTGPIPAGIGSLVNLTDLFLSRNQLTSPIPTQISSLTNLTRLDLSSNLFTGDIPAAISDLTSLSYLSLYNNQFIGSIPDAIQYLTGLTHLDFDDNQLTGPIPTWIGSLTNLEYLYLGGNPFDGQMIPDAIGSLPNLKRLGVNSFQLLPGTTRPAWTNLDSLTALHLWGRRESDAIPDWIGTLTQLTRFGLLQHQLSGGIPAWVGDFTSLEYLYIYDNQLAGAVPAAVANLSQLRYLYLHNNQLEDLPDLNPLKTSLLRLHVQDNRFTFEDIVPNVDVASEEVIYAPQDSVGLEQDKLVDVGTSLNLNFVVGGTGNQYQWLKDGDPISGAMNNTLNIAEVAPADAGSYVLRITNTDAPDLTLYSRPIHVTVPLPVAAADSLALVALNNSTGGGWTNAWDRGTPVADWFGVTVTGDRVTGLDLNNNNLSGPIPTGTNGIGKLTGLTVLNLSGNQLTGSIPTEIGNLTNLTDLRLHSNQLTGPIPTWIGDLTGLTYLNLSWNPLAGSIPTEIGSLVNLTDLRLMGDQLSGDIPAAIGSLGNLVDLRLSYNQITGLIPAEIGGLTKLHRLGLYDNQLTGSIPTEIGSLINLSELYLQRNQLTGPIPGEIGQLTNLSSLFLGGNPLAGLIPAEIGNLTTLSRLCVNSFQLPGAKPDWIGNLANLTYLRLYGRLESDVLPEWIGTLTQLLSFDLRDHQLSGGIPAWVGSLTNLYYLSICNNQLDGPIPTWIGGLTALEYLYIYDNQLAGAVPAAVANLSQLRYLYLHNNQLEDLPDLNPLKTSLLRLHVQDNRFTFEDIVPNVNVASEEVIYAPQDNVGLEQDKLVDVGTSLNLNFVVGGTGNQYQWLKDGEPKSGATNASLSIAAVAAADAGSYVLRTTNPGAPDLTLYSRPINVTVTVPPTAITRPPTNVTSAAAVLNGLVNPNGKNTTVSFKWGPSTGYGEVSVAEQSPVAGTADVAVSVPITSLTAGATYHYRVVATNTGGTTEGDDQVFTTPADENTIVDNRVIPGSGTVNFTSTDISMDFNFTNQTGEDVISVSQVAASPTGTLPDTVGLAASRYWIVEHEGSSTFDVAMTFVLWADAISGDDQAAPGNLRLLRRDTGSEDPWTEVVSGTSANDSSVTFASITGFSEFTIGSTSLAVDTEAPDIASVAIAIAAPVDAGIDVVVTASISDNRGVQDVFLHYGEGGAALNPTAMQAAGAGESYTHTYSIPGSDVTLRGLVFFVRATDAAENADTSAIQFVPVKYVSGALMSNISGSDFSGGFPRERWRLISIPTILTDPSVSRIIGDVLDSSTDTTWRIFAYSGNESDPWREAANSNFKRGEAYWLNQWVDGNIQFDAGAGTTDNLGSFDIIVKPGWNLIGTPYPFRSPIELDLQTYYGPITFTGSDTALAGWIGKSELAPWSGYAVYNRTSSNQTITLSAKPGGGLGKGLLAKETTEQPEGWLLQLQAEGKTYADVANAIGRLEGATEQLDYFDNPEPPYVDGFISLAMERDHWGANLPRFTSDIRSIEENDGVWDLDLFVKGEKGPITLSHDLQGDLPPGNRIILLDVMTREVHDLLADDRPLTFTRYREDFPYHLKVVAGSASYVEFTTKEILASLPSDFSLAQNYPNPFNPVTHLRYSLFQPARVTLKIYNLLGQEVVTLVDGWQDLGHYEVIWEGRDRFGVQAASGIYFAAYRAEGRLFTRKMVLMK